MAHTETPEAKYQQHEHLDGNMASDEALSKIKTAGSISISPELFEKIYLSPQNQVKGDLRKTFGNPTPVALVGFLLSLTPLSCDLMNFRGAQAGNGSASIGAYLGFGGILMLLGGLGEWILGNTFPGTVFLSFGAFWLTFGFTLIPFYHSFENYAPYDVPGGSGITAPPFNNAFGFFLLWMGVLCLIYLICALRTNIVFVLIFFLLVPAFGCLTAAFWYAALGNTDRFSTLLIAGGALAFVVCILGWWIFTAILFASLDFPIQLPVGDLSHIIKGGSEKV